MNEEVKKKVEFLKEIEKFKLTYRTSYLSDHSRRESDADHSWHLAMMAIVLKDHLPKELNFSKLLELALIHDLPEIYAGDTFGFDVEGQKNKKEREAKAAKKLFSILPEKSNARFTSLYKEYEMKETPESRIVSALDTICPIFQEIANNGKVWKDANISKEKAYNYNLWKIKFNGFLEDLHKNLIEEADNKHLFPKEE